jgi:hypothetical protein
MKYILIYCLSTTVSTSTGLATGAAEFGDRPSCERAGQEIKKEFGGWATNVRFVCAPSIMGHESIALPKGK